MLKNLQNTLRKRLPRFTPGEKSSYANLPTIDNDEDDGTPIKRPILVRHVEKIRNRYRSKFPWLYGLCFDPVGQHDRARRWFGFGLGLILGLLLYAFVISGLRLNDNLCRLCGVASIVALALGCAYSLQFRCVCLLTIPGFFGRAGRGVLKALILGYVITGPVFNLTLNAKEVMRSFACTGQLVTNMTKTKYDLMLAPFRQTMKNLNDSADEIRRTMSSINEVIKPIAKEIEGAEEIVEFDDIVLTDDNNKASGDADKDGATIDIDTTTAGTIIGERYRRERRSGAIDDDAIKRMAASKEYEAGYKRKISSRCKKQLKRGSERCREAFQNAYNRCYKRVTWVAGWILCWPMKLTFVCNLVETLGGNKVCNPEGKVDVGFGEGYAILKETRDKLNTSLTNASIEYKIETQKIATAQLKDAKRAAAGVMRDFEARRRFVDDLITFINRCLSLVFFKIIINAANYRFNYLTNVEHDNVYVTDYFRRIDARRRTRGAITLLPLKKLERTKLIDPYGVSQTKSEKRHLYGQTARLLLEVITVSLFVMLDKLLYELLDIIRGHARLEITQRGRFDVSLEIQGRGLVAKLIRKLVHGFNRKRSVSQRLSNEQCLPRPSRVPAIHLLGIYAGYFVVWLLVLLQAYGQRLRHVIAAYFYRRREKRRVLYLYNETLRRRRGFLRWARSRAGQATRGKLMLPEARFLLELRDKRPNVWAWLRRLGWAGLDCVVCGDPEPRGGKTPHHVCRGSDCIAAYCEECWRDLGRSCWATGCATGTQDDSARGDVRITTHDNNDDGDDNHDDNAVDDEDDNDDD